MLDVAVGAPDPLTEARVTVADVMHDENRTRGRRQPYRAVVSSVGALWRRHRTRGPGLVRVVTERAKAPAQEEVGNAAAK